MPRPVRSRPGSDDATYLVAQLHLDGTEANDIILVSTTSGGLPFNAVGTAISYTPNAAGMVYLRAA